MTTTWSIAQLDRNAANGGVTVAPAYGKVDLTTHHSHRVTS